MQKKIIKNLFQRIRNKIVKEIKGYIKDNIEWNTNTQKLS